MSRMMISWFHEICEYQDPKTTLLHVQKGSFTFSLVWLIDVLHSYIFISKMALEDIPSDQAQQSHLIQLNLIQYQTW